MPLPLPRRLWLAAPALLLGGATGAPRIGEAVEVVGTGRAERPGASRSLLPMAELLQGDTLVTGAESRLRVTLRGGIDLRLGAEARLLLDSLAGGAQRGPGTVLRLASGAFLFDRAESAPRSPVAVVSPAALIAVRGTHFWGGPIDGVFGVLVVRGAVEVTAGGQRVALGAGLGVEIREGGPPDMPRPWEAARTARAWAAVGARP
jgi:ferric-dicitrate binding protein FerR (iron transport regulator)